VSATVGGRQVQVGSPGLLIESASDAAPERMESVDLAEAMVGDLESAGRTAVVVVVDGVPVGVPGLADRVRPNARVTVVGLTAMTGQVPILLTGTTRVPPGASPPRSG